MRIKIIQRFLSMMIATATVLAIPGFASAGKYHTGGGDKNAPKKISKFALRVPQFASDDESDDDCKKGAPKKDLDLKNKVAVVAEPEKKKPPLNSFLGLVNLEYSRLDAILHAASESENEKKHFVLLIRTFYQFDFFANWAKKNADDVLKTLLCCSLTEAFRKDVPEIITNLFKEGYFQNWADSKIIELLKGFTKFKNNTSQPVILEVVENLSSLGHFKNLDEIEMRHMFDILYEAFCLGCDQKIMTAAIRALTENGCFENCSSDVVFNVIYLLNRCLCENQAEADVVMNIAYVMKYFVSGKYFSNFNENQANFVVNLLCRCANYDFARAAVADVAKCLTGFENFQSFAAKLDDVLKLCCPDSEKLNSTALKTAHNIKTESSNQDASENKMEIESSNQDASKNKIIIDLSDSKEKKKVKNNPMSSINIKSNMISLCKKLKKDGEKIAPDIEKLVNISWLQQAGDGNSLNDKISQMINIFLKCCDHDEAKKHIVDMIGYTADNNMLKNSSKEEIRQILYILNKCADNVDVKRSVAIDIGKLARKDLFLNADVENIQNVLKKCLDGYGAKVLIAAAIATLAEKNLFVQHHNV